jgi:3-oxoacyl-[acyl-carrier-protein] synthase-3
MPSFNIPNVLINGIAACVPKNIETVRSLNSDVFDNVKFTAVTGVKERRIADSKTCTSDLCVAAADEVIKKLNWDKSEISAIVFVTQTPDYSIPSTSPIIQHRLGLSTNCFSIDISLGCSGYVVGMTVLANLISTGSIKKGLLLVGDTISKVSSKEDYSVYPIFGDAGTATAFSYDTSAPVMSFDLFSDGEGYKSIIIEDSGFRNQPMSHSFEVTEIAPNIKRAANHLVLEGMDVFSFGISKAPHVIKSIIQNNNIATDTINYYVFHQANKMMNDKIKKSLKLPDAKVPYSIENFGNTSSASIPLTIVDKLREEVENKELKMLLCGFGVGLSWGAAAVNFNKIVCPPIVEI